jgi:hypothetical protein
VPEGEMALLEMNDRHLAVYCSEFTVYGCLRFAVGSLPFAARLT